MLFLFFFFFFFFYCELFFFFFFFFQAEDGIRDLIVTGVQTCALPISGGHASRLRRRDVSAPAAADAARTRRLCPRARGRRRRRCRSAATAIARATNRRTHGGRPFPRRRRGARSRRTRARWVGRPDAT